MEEQLETRLAPSDETAKRGLGTGLLTKLAEGGATGIGIVAGKAAAEHVLDTIKNRPAEDPPPQIVLPPGVKTDE